jgi:hypothetical protein
MQWLIHGVVVKLTIDKLDAKMLMMMIQYYFETPPHFLWSRTDSLLFFFLVLDSLVFVVDDD